MTTTVKRISPSLTITSRIVHGFELNTACKTAI